MKFAGRQTCFITTLIVIITLRVVAQNSFKVALSPNGLLSCSNLQPGSAATVLWTPSLTQPWQSNLANLNSIAVGSNGAIQVSVPMPQGSASTLFIVRGLPVPAGMVLVQAGSFTMGDALG